MEKLKDEWDNYSQYLRYTEAQPLKSSIMGVDVGWDRPSTSSQTWHKEEPDTEDPDGQLYEPDEDPELTRKRKELQVIEERILLTRASIALKNVDPYLKMMWSGSGANEEGQETSETLRDRVKTILQQRHPHGFLLKGQLPKNRLNSSTRKQDNHPLKLRVESLLRRRFTNHSVETENSEAPFVSTPPRQNVTSPPNAECNANKGFMRFLDILNKGVDINLLSKIVNDDSETLPTSEDTSSPRSSPQQRLSHSDSREKTSVTPCHNEKHLRSQSRSPPSLKKIKKEEDGQPHLDEQHKTLQNVLQSLGLSLEVDEMSRLTDRTQERLYGKKQCVQEKSDGEEQDRKERYSPGRYTRSSSFSSSGSSISSRSSSSSPGPSRRSTETTHKDSHRQYQTFSPAQTNAYSSNYTVSNSSGATHSSTHPQHQMYPYSQTDEYSASYNNAHYFEKSAHKNYDSTDPTNYWKYYHPIPNSDTPNNISVLQTQHITPHNFPATAPEAHTDDKEPLDQKWGLENCDFSSNADQPRCLITVKQGGFSTYSEKLKYFMNLKNIDINMYKQRKKLQRKRNEQKKRLENDIEHMEARRVKNRRIKSRKRRHAYMERAQAELEAKRSGTDKPQTEVRRVLTDEEIKANLKKKLEAFNKRMKQNLATPASYPTTHNSNVEDEI